MTTYEQVEAYYDDYVKRQKRIGQNLRHYYLFNQLVKAGLKKHHHVLEIGCGIGTLTELIGKYLTRGKIIGTDISSESIALARSHFKSRKNAAFFVTDMQEFSYPQKFDFIVLADVLEHIPMEHHGNLFRIFSQHAHEDSTVFINIPHPKYSELSTQMAPETMQIIDQAVPADFMVKNAYDAGFTLHQYQAYCLFNEIEDYYLIQFKTDKAYEKLEPRSKLKIILRKTGLRFKTLYHLLRP